VAEGKSYQSEEVSVASLVRINIFSDSLEGLRKIVKREVMDLNCGGAKRTATGEWRVEAYVPQEVATKLQEAGVRVEVDTEFGKRAASRRAEVGDGDRFQGGRIPPRGVGRKE
jgi:hypothetical protein